MEAELGAQRLTKDGVDVLDDPRAAVGEGARLWVDSGRIEVAIDAAVKQAKQAYSVKAGSKKQAQRIHVSLKTR